MLLIRKVKRAYIFNYYELAARIGSVQCIEIYRVAQKSKLLYCVNSLLFLSHPVFLERVICCRPLSVNYTVSGKRCHFIFACNSAKF